MMHGFFHGYFHGWGMTFGWLIGMAFLVLVIWLVVRLASRTTNFPQHATRSALDILNERYARGEIDTEEYKEKKKEILG
jgi:putative membrane protein